VTTTDDSGTGRLRDAIIAANGTGGGDLIEFHIPGTGTHTITLLTPLPAISSIVTMTGETEEGWVAATATTAAVLRVELDGSTARGIGLTLNGVGSVVRVLAVNRFSTGIRANVNDIVIAGNHIGTSLNGLTDLGNTTIGIDADTAVGIIIGGLTAADRNVISGNGGDGVQFSGVNGASVLGNYLGTDATGLAPLQNDGDGMEIFPGSNNFIESQI